MTRRLTSFWLPFHSLHSFHSRLRDVSLWVILKTYTQKIGWTLSSSILLSYFKICLICPGINFWKISRSLLTINLSNPYFQNNSTKNKVSLSSLSRIDHQCTPGLLCGSLFAIIKGYFALPLCWISFMNSLFLSAGKTPTKLFNRFYPLVLKKRSSSKLDTPNPSTSIIILNKLYLSPYLIILLLYLENFFDFFVLEFGSTYIV